VSRLYSEFPDRAPGAGLLLLRVTVGATLIAQAVLHISELGDSKPAFAVFCVLALVLGACLILGFLTRIAALVIASLAAGFTWLLLMAGSSDLLPNLLLSINAVILGTAIVLLGPGALSFDAVLFGRRQVIIPRSTPASKL
jgi:uncharacterized membrane protein YphA (DoxX/SURF4 family)